MEENWCDCLMPHRLMHRAMGAYKFVIGVGFGLCIAEH